MAIHAMIDLETLATDPNATILTIGGVKFNPNTNEEPHSEFYYKLNVDEQEKLGRTQDQGTIDWWGKQDPKIMEEAFGEEDRVGLVHFLNHFLGQEMRHLHRPLHIVRFRCLRDTGRRLLGLFLVHRVCAYPLRCQLTRSN